MRTKKQLIACGLSFSLLFGMIPFNEVSAAKKVRLSTKKLSVTEGAGKTLKVKNTKKKVKWKILSGKKCIVLKKKGKVAVTIKGRKQGVAKVRAVIGKTKLTCKVTVKAAKKQKSPELNTSTPPTATNNPGVTPPPSSGTQAPSSTTTPSAGTSPAISLTNVPPGANKQDVAAISTLIAEQLGHGVTVSKDMNSGEYGWDSDGKLVTIDWPDKKLSGELNVSGCVNLEYLGCSNNQLSSLDVSGCVNLETLWCDNNQLSSLDVNGCVNLKNLDCDNNQLSNLDVSGCANLETLWCSNNQLSNLDVSGCANLETLRCSNNQLSSLDVTNNSKLSQLSCDDTVNVIGYHPSAGANEQDINALKELIAEQRERGVMVSEDLDSSEYKWKDGKLIEIRWSCKNLSGELNVSGCANLETLWCDNNQLNRLDVSGCVNLETLRCYKNQLSSLDVSGCANLETLWCDKNQLSSLDVSKNTALRWLECANNQLNRLDVSGCANLEELSCSSNQLSSLDVSKNTALIGLWCSSNQLSSLDVSGCVNLGTLEHDDTVTVIGYHPNAGANEQDI